MQHAISYSVYLDGFMKRGKYLGIFTGLIGIWFLLTSYYPNGNNVEKPISRSGTDSLSALERIQLFEKSLALTQLIEEKKLIKNFTGTVLIAEKGQILFAGAYGYANKNNKEPINLESAFELASVSKTFTGVAIMMLYDQGKLQFDDPVSLYLPDFPYPAITIRHLLTHRSGLPNYMWLAEKYWNRRQALTNEDMYKLFAQHKPRLIFNINGKFDYSNTNYAFLACIVEHITQTKFDDFVEQKIFLPLGMTASKVHHAAEKTEVPLMVSGHKYAVQQPIDKDSYFINGVMGDKGVYSTVTDMLKFDQALYTDFPVKQTTLQLGFAPGSPEAQYANKNYGFGFRMRIDGGKRIIYHNGWWQGFKTAFKRYVDEKKTLIVLSNSDRKLPQPYILEYALLHGKEAFAEADSLFVEEE